LRHGWVAVVRKCEGGCVKENSCLSLSMELDPFLSDKSAGALNGSTINFCLKFLFGSDFVIPLRDNQSPDYLTASSQYVRLRRKQLDITRTIIMSQDDNRDAVNVCIHDLSSLGSLSVFPSYGYLIFKFHRLF